MHPAVKGHPMATGTVKWFNETKGYGFIQPDQGGKDVFVHISAVERSGMRGLAEGQKVSYDVEADRRTGKEAAANLKAASRESPSREEGSIRKADRLFLADVEGLGITLAAALEGRRHGNRAALHLRQPNHRA